MKEASGELSMTLVTIIAVGIIVGIFALFWPQISATINKIWGNFENKAGNPNGTGSGQVDMIIKDYIIDFKN